MPIVVSPYWSKEQYQRNERAAKSYLVTGVATADEASDAVPYQKGNTHPLDTRLVAEQPALVGQPGVLAFEIQVNFVKQENVNPGTGGGAETPIDEPLVWKWVPGTTVEPASHDIAGNPILNSAGRPFNPLPTREYNTLFLEVERNESSFDLSVSIEYQGSINSNTFSVKTGGGQSKNVPPGKCKLLSYAPMSFYNEDTPYVRCRYLFEFRDYFPGADADEAYKSSFQWRLLDQGTDGWYTIEDVGTPGRITDAEGNPVTSDVLLDGQGRVWDTQYKVNGQDSEATPASTPSAPGAIRDLQESAMYLLYRRCISKDFTGLNLGG